MAKRILIFSLAYHPHVGGAEVAIKEITDRIPNIEFHLVTLRFSKNDAAEETIGNIVVHRVGGGTSALSKMFFVLSAAKKARALHATLHFDAVWVMMSYMLLPLLLSRMGVPYALTLQEGDTYAHMFGRLRILPFLPFIKRGFVNATVVQVISTYLASWARCMGHSNDIQVIPNGVDLRAFAGERQPHEGIVLITTSRLVRKNGVDTIVRALPLLPEVSLHIVGSGIEEQKLRAAATRLGVLERVRFCGHVNPTNVPQHLRAADIFVRPSRSEGMGNSFIEAMAVGLPVIATQVGGISDFLFDARRNPNKAPTGFAVDVDAPEQIAMQVHYILEHPGEVQKVVENAKHMVEETYSWDTIAHDMQEKVFEPLLYDRDMP